MLLLVIIDDLNVFHSGGSPDKAESPLVVYSNAILANPVTFQSFQPITWRYSKVVQLSSDLQLS